MNLDKLKKARRRGTDRRWTLLFIGDHGNVITIKRFKTIIVAVGCLFLLVSALLIVLYYSHQKNQRKHTELQTRFEDSQKQIETLRHEKEILMARLVVAESKIKEKAVENQQPKETQIAAKPADTKAAPKPKPAPRPPKKTPAPVENQQDEAQKVMRVTVDSFSVSRDSDNTNIKAQFKVRNASIGYQQAAGHAVIILKGTDLEEYQWLVMPSVAIADSKPTGRRGKNFSIKRYRTMNFTGRAPKHADQFQTAVVYVFAKDGQLLLERDFAIKLKPLPAVSSQTEAEDARPRATPLAETPPQQPPAQQKPTPEKPADVSTSSDEDLDNLEKAPPVF